MINPEEDGITHINIYSKGKTQLGRFLSNFAYFPFKCEDGDFVSVEGYWYWLSTKDDRLRTLHGFAAKKLGRELRGEDWNESEEFKNKIKKAISFKLLPCMEDLYEVKVPFTHYYLYGDKVVEPSSGKWIVEYIQEFKNKINYSTKITLT